MTGVGVDLTAKIEPLTLLALVESQQRIGCRRDG